jgi:hypothetical protein
VVEGRRWPCGGRQRRERGLALVVKSAQLWGELGKAAPGVRLHSVVAQILGQYGDRLRLRRELVEVGKGDEITRGVRCLVGLAAVEVVIVVFGVVLVWKL